MVFKPRLTTRVFDCLMGISSILVAAFLYWALITQYMDISVMIPMIFLCIGSLIFGGYLLASCWLMCLMITDKSILYKEPFYTVACEWEHVKGAIYSDEYFLLRLDETIKPSRNWIIRNWIKVDDHKEAFIPIHKFVKSWKNLENWQQSALLKAIAFHLPGLDKEITRNEREQVDPKTNE